MLLYRMVKLGTIWAHSAFWNVAVSSEIPGTCTGVMEMDTCLPDAVVEETSAVAVAVAIYRYYLRCLSPLLSISIALAVAVYCSCHRSLLLLPSLSIALAVSVYCSCCLCLLLLLFLAIAKQ